MSEEGWKRFGLIKGPGLPAPSGQYTVGCVDLMHKLEGDSDGILVRLFYPTTPQIQAEGAARYQYAKWMPDKRYVKASLARSGSRYPGLISTVTSLILDPRVPAFEGAPLYQHRSKQVADTGDKASDPSDVKTEDKEGETVENGTSKEEQRQSDQSAEEEQWTTTTMTPPTVTPEIFPVVVFSHGLAAMRTMYCGICSDLASHGLIVAAVEHRDGSAAVVLKRVPKPGGPEGQLVDEWMEYDKPESERDAEFDPQNYQDVPLRHEQVKKRSFDVKQALNVLHLLNNGSIQNMLDHSKDYDFSQFKGRLDVEAAAIMGHSFGGGTTVLALHDEPRFKCGIALDGWMVPFPEDFLEGLSVSQPLLFINSYSWQWKRNIQSIMKLIRSSKDKGNSSCFIVTLKDTDHYNQTDLKFALPAFVLKQLRKSDTIIDPVIAHRINQQICHAFLKRHLITDPACQQNVPELDGGEGCLEYIIHGTNVDLSVSTDSNTDEQPGTEPQSSQGTESPVDII